MMDVRGAPQLVVLEDEQYVPPQLDAHEPDDAVREVRVSVNARHLDDPLDMRSEFR